MDMKEEEGGGTGEAMKQDFLEGGREKGKDGDCVVSEGTFRTALPGKAALGAESQAQPTLLSSRTIPGLMNSGNICSVFPGCKTPRGTKSLGGSAETVPGMEAGDDSRGAPQHGWRSALVPHHLQRLG